MSLITLDRRPPLLIVSINRPEVRNAVDGPTAQALADAFREFDADPALSVAILTGAGDHFCAGADLKAVAGVQGSASRAPSTHESGAMRPGPQANRLAIDGDGPMGPTRMQLSKPVIAAVAGYCVAGGLELAAWCDLRVASEDAVFGVFCRRFGVPLIDGGTVRLPRLIGMSRAMDMMLTGRAVDAQEALQIGLANRVVARKELMAAAEALALQIAGFPQTCLRGDRLSAYQQWGMGEAEAIHNEFGHGMRTLASGETVAGAGRFSGGEGRHGRFGSE